MAPKAWQQGLLPQSERMPTQIFLSGSASPVLNRTAIRRSEGESGGRLPERIVV